MIRASVPVVCRALATALGCLLVAGLGGGVGAIRAEAQQLGAPAGPPPAAGFSGTGNGAPAISLQGTSPGAPVPGLPDANAPAGLVTPAPPVAIETPPPADGTVTGTTGGATPDAGLTPLPALTTRTPVVLELFTAEGCASCLAADANLGNWARQRSVLVLTYHVDYWDYIGWRDMKADPAFAQRQLGYVGAFGRNMVYTPQVIVGGADETLGTDRDRLSMMLSNSRYIATMAPLRLLRDAGGQVFADLPAIALSKPATVWLVSFRRQVETDILAGENAGRHVSAVNVVRAVRKIGAWNGSAQRLPVPIDLKAGGDIPADAAAVIANQAEYGPVIAATAIAYDSLR
jgi:hypothetical protein